MSDVYKQIMGLLPQCSADDVARLSVALKAWTSLPGNSSGAQAPSEEKDGDTNFVLRCIIDVCRKNGVDIISAAMLQQSRNYPNFKRKVPAIMAFLRKAHRKRSVQQAILCLGLEATRDWLVNIGVPVSAGTLLQHIHRVPSVLDQHFPGYARMGVLGSIFKPRKEKSCQSKSA